MPKKQSTGSWTIRDFARYYGAHIDLDFAPAGDEFQPLEPTRMLLIPDEATLERFLTNAKNIWIGHHHSTRGRGRPSERGRVFRILWDDEINNSPKRVTQGKLIRLVQSELGTDTLSEDAIRKYVKMWLILKRNGKVIPDLSLPAADLRWLNKHASKTMKAIRAYRDLSKAIAPALKVTGLSGSLMRSAAIDGTLDVDKLFYMPHSTPDALRCDADLRKEIQDFLPPKLSR